MTASLSRRIGWLERIALVATLLVPLFLMHGHGIAEGLIGLTDGCFLIRSAVRRDWRWLRSGWVPLGLAWWGWEVVCSLPVPALDLGSGGLDSLGQALATVRFLLFAAALDHAVLRDPTARRTLFKILAACVAYIAAQVALQFATGLNLYGNHAGAAGELTGPFNKPRAGPPLARLLPPTLLPAVAALLARARTGAALAAYITLATAVAVMVVIGQRMPLLLTGFGLVIAGLLLKKLRPVVLAAGLAGALVVAASSVVAPAAHHRLVQQFSSQMEHFGASHYGFLLQRSLAIASQHPWTGRGFDGFRTGCPRPRYFQPGAGQDLSAEFCTQHPHNFYLQALTDGGIPGLVLFSALVVAWLIPLARGLWRDPDPLRVGLFASMVIQLWPIASTSGFTSMPMGGWLFLLLGYALAEARAWQTTATATRGAPGPSRRIRTGIGSAAPVERRRPAELGAEPTGELG